MKRILCAFALACGLAAGSSHAVPLNNIPPLVPLYESYDSAHQDYFYTIDAAQHQLALGMGYVAMQPAGYLERKAQPNTKRFRRFYKDFPEYDHFYTHSSSEAQTVLSMGYVEEQSEGYIYTGRVPGSIALYRLNYWNPSNGDQVHRYTTSSSTMSSLRAAGWGYDGIAGYVYPTAELALTNGAIMALRCPGDGASAATCWNGPKPEFYRDYFTRTILKTPAGAKPSGSTRQVVSFQFWSPDFFRGGGDHIAFGAHGHMNINQPDVAKFCPLAGAAPGQAASNCTWQRALGVILFQSPWSALGHRRFGAEAWWIGENANATNAAVRAPVSEPAFANNVTYGMRIEVTDQGYLTATLHDPYGIEIGRAEWNTAATATYPSFSPFPAELSNLFIAPAGMGDTDYTLYIANINVRWE